MYSGVCDCCDGADEEGSLFNAVCEDTCAAQAASVHQLLLADYNKIKMGNLAKSKTVDSLRRKKFREQQTLDHLLNEQKELEILSASINCFIYDESWQEFWMQFKVLRMFESECAAGVYEACHIQERGVEPQYGIFADIIGGR